MKFLFKAEWDIEAGNKVMREGKMPEVIESILEDIKPEAVYFLASNGTRTTLLIVDIEDTSQIPRIAEPWFHSFNARVEFQPVMLPEDLARAGEAISKAVAKYA